MQAAGDLVVLLDSLSVGTPGKFGVTLALPPGVWPVYVERAEDRIGRITIVCDPKLFAEESLPQGLFEPLTHEYPEGELWITDPIGRRLLEDSPELPSFEDDLAFHALDPSGATLLRVRASGPAEVAWWYGGEDTREDQGITALDVILDSACDPMDSDSPVRNMGEVIRAFLDEHGPPSLRSE